MDAINTGDTAWVLVSAALVLLMTPGLALFYGGMVRSKSVLNMMMMSFAAMGIVGVLWVLVGYSMAFGDSLGGLIGNPLDFAGLNTMLNPDSVVGTVPSTVFAGFQAAFAIIAVALISGAVADRMKFSAWAVFAAVWALSRTVRDRGWDAMMLAASPAVVLTGLINWDLVPVALTARASSIAAQFLDGRAEQFFCRWEL